MQRPNSNNFSRGSRYGEFAEHARITQNIKAAMVDSPNWAKLPHYQKEALEMVAHKFGRLLNGDFMYEDNLIDTVGYAQLALNDTKAANSKVAEHLTVSNIPSLAKSPKSVSKPK